MDRIAYMKSVNFEFLRPGNELLANLAGLAEAVIHIDPGSALTRLRSFAEELTKGIYKEELLPRIASASLWFTKSTSCVFRAMTPLMVRKVTCAMRSWH